MSTEAGQQFTKAEIAGFVALFDAGDLSKAQEYLQRHQDRVVVSGYEAHSLLRAFVRQNQGHCYKEAHLAIAELLIPAGLRSFRDVVLSDDLSAVKDALAADHSLIHGEFTAGRGIARAIHHWRSVDVGKALIDAGSDLQVLTTRGESPLGMQGRFGSIEGMRLLLESGADANEGVSGTLPSGDLEERLQLLLAHGWDIAQAPLLHDANHGFGKRIAIWLKYGADPNQVNEKGQTALHLLAARGKGAAAVKALVNAGADWSARDDEGLTPRDVADRGTRKTVRDAIPCAP